MTRSKNVTVTGLACSVAALVVLVGGCSSVGPHTIPRDRFDYSGALAESWKAQILLNVVKTRYLDVPIYLEVGQIVSGYSLETGVSLSGQISPQSMRGDTFGALGASGTFTDRPTITYTPMMGEKFLLSYLTPINPAKLFSLVQAGYAAEFVLELGLETLSGWRNRPVSLGTKRKADAEFFCALALLREIQDAGAMGMRMEGATNAPMTPWFFFRTDNATAEVAAKIEEMRHLLGLSPAQTGYRLVQSPMRGGAGELSVATRSLSQVMVALALGVEVPPKHQLRKLTPPLQSISADEQPLLRVHSGTKAPVDVFVAVPYEGEWFWIANDDWKSKRTFTSILFLFTLVDTGGADKLPTITIPAQ